MRIIPGYMPVSLFILGLIAIFTYTVADCNQLKNQPREIDLTVRNVSYPEKDPGGNELATNHYQLRERSIKIPVEKSALILVDTWEISNPRKGEIQLYENMIQKKIKPLLNAARENNMLVLHAAHRKIDWNGKCLDAPLDLRSPTSTSRDNLPSYVIPERIPPDQWPPAEFVFRVGKYGQYAQNTSPSYMPYTQVLGLHPSLKPVQRDREFIESDLKRIQQIFRENGILHLFYVGGATNQCIMNRPVGIRNMAPMGYNTIILRDATMALELTDTWDTLEITNSAVREIEINFGFSALSTELIEALSGLKKKP
jgi:nicotinamidase-related amidase